MKIISDEGRTKDTLTSQEIGGDMAQAGKVFYMISVNEPTNGDALNLF